MTGKQRLLIVDDDTSILEVLEARLESAGFLVERATSGRLALDILNNSKIDLLISDMKMPEISGMELQEEVRKIYPNLPIIFLTAFGTIPGAVSALKAGAVDYLTKPFDGRELLAKINQIFEAAPAPVVPEQRSSNYFWGKSPSMTKLKDLLQRLSGSSANVLVLGESGVGKERIARLLHENGSSRKGPFVVVDCGSTPPGILESELFGHVKGAFTNAVKDKKGLIEAAEGGTLFLDEVGNISSEMQVRLLRFLEEHTIRRVGSTKERQVECRVLAATNADLQDEVRNNRFRQDLYYRLKVVTVTLPPLRERRQDIPELAQFLIKAHCKAENLPSPTLSDETLKLLLTYDWPGNVRELKNCLLSGILLCSNEVITPEDLQLDDLVNLSVQQTENDFSMEQSEKAAIIRALKQTGGVKKEAAKLLGISRRAIQYKTKKYELDSAKFRK